MRFLQPASLRQRMLLISTLVTLVTLLVTVTLFVVYDMRALRAQMVRDLAVLAEVVGDNCLSALVFDSPETAERNLGTLRREYQIRYAMLYDAEGRRFAAYQRDPEQALHDPSWPDPGVVLDVSLLGLGSVEIVRELDLEGRPVGSIFIHARMDEWAAHLRHYAWIVALLCCVALAVSLTLALRLQRQITGPICELASMTRDISTQGDYSLRAVLPPSDDEIAELLRAFNAMLGQIERRDRDLLRVKVELEQANSQLRSLAMEISLVAEQEKKRLAGQLHDSPMQKLALAQGQITSALRRRDRESRALLEVGLELVRDALSELRTLQFELSPPVLHESGVEAALQWLASSVSQRFGIAMTFEPGDSDRAVDEDLGVVLFQCARELVHNVVRHADATAARIGFHVNQEEVRLVVSDNGKGLDEGPDRPLAGQGLGYGLYSVRERVSLLGGEFSLASDGRGTRAVLRVPLTGWQGKSAPAGGVK